jgi:hypothetical protein
VVSVKIGTSRRREGEGIDASARLRGAGQLCGRRREGGTCGDALPARLVSRLCSPMSAKRVGIVAWTGSTPWFGAAATMLR